MYSPLGSPFRALACILVSVPGLVWADAIQTIDDRDLRITYKGGWSKQGGPNEYDSSTMLTRKYQANASLTFSGTVFVFPLFVLLSSPSSELVDVDTANSGFQVAVYGSLRPNGNYTTQSTYSVDGGSPTTFTTPDEHDALQYRVQFFSSARLSNSQHTLVITNYGDWYFLDNIQVTVTDLDTSSSPVSLLSSSPSPAISSTQPGGTDKSPASTANSQSILNLSSANTALLGTGATVGIVMASIGLLAALAISFVFFKKRNVSRGRQNSSTLNIPGFPVGMCTFFSI